MFSVGFLCIFIFFFLTYWCFPEFHLNVSIQFFFFFDHTTRPTGSEFPNQGLNSGPQQWEHQSYPTDCQGVPHLKTILSASLCISFFSGCIKLYTQAITVYSVDIWLVRVSCINLALLIFPTRDCFTYCIYSTKLENHIKHRFNFSPRHQT